MRFGLMSIPGSAREAMVELRTAEEAGFDVIATADHMRHPRDAGLPLLDGWSVAAAWAGVSQRIRIAVLVSNLIIRNPAVLAKQAVTVDQLSGGRLDLGVGAGVYRTDHAMAGVPWWPPPERVARFADFVRALAAALAGAAAYDGPFYRFDDASVSPGPVQQPGPPLVLGAAGPRMLRVVAELADVWSAYGGIGVDDEQAFFAATAAQIQTVQAACAQVGRDPATLRRSLVAYRPIAPWSGLAAFERLIETAGQLGFDELILYPPANDDERRTFELALAQVLPRYR
jgi:alkanesulfonate monooxygenase SsuD/methylene tetrahydromethanopterin reductase-like flavin-dependent oxidoreductase (luciferase family)